MFQEFGFLKIKEFDRWLITLKAFAVSLNRPNFLDSLWLLNHAATTYTFFEGNIESDQPSKFPCLIVFDQYTFCVD